MWDGKEGKPIAGAVEKIAKECEKAGCSAWTVTKVIKEILGEENASESALRKKAIEVLNKLDPASAQVYVSFQRMLVRTSRQTIEHFDRGNIIRSLLRETDVTRGVAEKIGHEVEEKIKDLEIGSISTALIREMVNVKLLEYGHENIRNQYARLGLPVSDVKKMVRQSPKGSPDVLVDFNLLRVIPKKFGDMHLRSDIFIAALEDFSTKPVSHCHPFKKYDALNETIFNNIRKMNRLSWFVSWPINATDVNVALAGNLNKRTLKKGVQLFANAFSAVFPHRRSVPRNIGIGLFVPERFEGIDRSVLAASTNAFLREPNAFGAANNNPVLVLDTKYRLKLLSGPQFEGSTLVNCRDKDLLPLNGIAAEKNLCGMFGLNIEKYASEGNEQAFFGKLEESITSIRELAKIKKAILSKREYLSRAGINPKEMQDAIGLYGLFEAAVRITGENKDKEIIKFAEKTVSLVSKSLGNGFVLTELLNKRGISRFKAENNSKADHKKQGLLSESETLLGKMQLLARAENKREASDLIDKGAVWITA